MSNQSREVLAFIEDLKRYANNFDTVFWLDSCNLPNPFDIGAYELVVGLGVRDELELTHDLFNWSQFQDFILDDSWKFFALSYDLNQQTAGIKSIKKDVFDWPLVSCVKPKIIVTVSKSGHIDTSGVELEALQKTLQKLTKPKKSVNAITKFESMRPSMTQDEHKSKVNRIKSEIAKGNMYEMNLCMEYLLEGFQCSDPFVLYHNLIKVSPTPFSSYVKIKNIHVMCASPERYVTTQNGRVYSQPIKGTSVRYEDFQKDQDSKLHLANSIKERAEHIMIVDLVRNDLSKLSKPGSIRVDELFGIYGYRHVNQMISTVSGNLKEKANFCKAVSASYPMGSMTGAPKQIVMKFIDELETAARGWYSGSIGYIKPNGEYDSNVVIRTLLHDSDKNLAKFDVGGAITYDSDPDQEYLECLLKSKAIRQILDIS